MRAQTISRVLKAAGVTRGGWGGGRVKGWGTARRGFVAEQHGDAVRVEWMMGETYRDDDLARERAAQAVGVEQIATVLKAKGYTVETVKGRYDWDVMEVTA